MDSLNAELNWDALYESELFKSVFYKEAKKFYTVTSKYEET